MKVLFLFVFALLFQNGFAQSATDTLYFGNKKYALQKTKLNYDSWQPGIVNLPVEYKTLKKKLSISYNSFSDSAYVFEDGKDDTHYMVTKPLKKIPEEDLHINLNSFLDTIKVKTEELYKLTPYIKRNNKKIYFSSIRLLHNQNGILNEFTAGRLAKGGVFLFFDFFNDNYHLKLWKQSTFIITDLYYQRGNATYYFDRNFIILCE